MVSRRRSAAFIALLLTACSNEPGAVRDSSVETVRTTQPRRATTTSSSAETSTTTTTLLIALPVPQPPPEPRAPDAGGPPVGSIEIPRLGLDSSLFEGISLNTLDRGPGHWPGTAMPGTLGNVVIGGHRTSKAKPFRHLDQLVSGDEVIFTTDAGRFVYLVVQTEIVTPDSMWIVDQTNAFTATLFACNPVGSTTERIVVFLELTV